ncbi:MAG: hypothetical protein ACQESF_02455 [Nanobdellota archaeon]
MAIIFEKQNLKEYSAIKREESVTAPNRISNPEKIMEKYLGLEEKMKTLFENLDFCMENCISKTSSLMNSNIPGFIGCCNMNYHIFDNHDNIVKEFFLQRNKLYGLVEPAKVFKEGEMEYSECCYHSDDGCILKTHKSPTCISYICETFRNYMKSKGISYNSFYVNKRLDELLSARSSKEDIKDFSNTIDRWLEKI